MANTDEPERRPDDAQVLVAKEPVTNEAQPYAQADTIPIASQVSAAFRITSNGKVASNG